MCVKHTSFKNIQKNNPNEAKFAFNQALFPRNLRENLSCSLPAMYSMPNVMNLEV